MRASNRCGARRGWISDHIHHQYGGAREVTVLKLEIQEIMKGSYSSFMQKEIFEQPESVVSEAFFGGRGGLSRTMQSVLR